MIPPFPILLMARYLSSGGSERQVVSTARFLDPALFQVHVASFRGGVREQELRQAGIPTHRLPVRSFMRPSLLCGAWEFLSLLRKKRIRLVHTFDVPTNIFAPPLSFLPLHDQCVILGSARAHRDLLNPRLRRLLRYTDRLVDGIVTNCEFIQRHLVEDEHVPEQRIDLCRNGIDRTEFHPGDRARPAEFAPAELVIGVVCVLRPEKDLGTLVKAFAMVANLRSGLVLAIVGSGPCRDELKTLSASLGVADQCRFIPDQARVAPFLRGIDIFALPSLSEASSNSLLEAMSCGCCPVASRVGGNPELVNESTGLLFEAGNAEDLAAALRTLIERTEQRQCFSQNAVQFTEQFTVGASARRMQEIYLKHLRYSPKAA